MNITYNDSELNIDVTNMLISEFITTYRDIFKGRYTLSGLDEIQEILLNEEYMSKHDLRHYLKWCRKHLPNKYVYPLDVKELLDEYMIDRSEENMDEYEKDCFRYGMGNRSQHTRRCVINFLSLMYKVANRYCCVPLGNYVTFALNDTVDYGEGRSAGHFDGECMGALTSYGEASNAKNDAINIGYNNFMNHHINQLLDYHLTIERGEVYDWSKL